MKRKILLCTLAAVLLGLTVALITGAMADAKWPKSSSGSEKTNGKLKLDSSYSSDGYFMAACTKKAKTSSSSASSRTEKR